MEMLVIQILVDGIVLQILAIDLDCLMPAVLYHHII